MVSYSNYTTAELYQLIAGGDEQAFHFVYEQHWRKLFRFLYRMTKSREVAEELVADVFLKLWIGRELVPEIHNLDGFLYQIGRRKALDFLRLTARQSSLQKVVSLQMISEVLASTERPDQSLIEEEYRSTIEAAILQLSPQRKKIFIMSREEGMTHEEIGRELNLSPKTIKRTISDALESIRTYLKEHPDVRILLWLFFLI